MSQQALTNLVVRRAAGALGAFVEGVSLKDIAESEAVYVAVHQAILEHEVLFFRDQQMTPALFAAFAKRFGQVLGHPAYDTIADAPDVQILESTAAKPSKIEVWHSDMTFMQQPPSYTLLQGQIIPEIGGDTLWSSASAAYSGLSAGMRKMLRPLWAVHDFRQGFRESLAEPGGAERLADTLALHPPVVHPVIRRHPESGRLGIYVNPLFTTHIQCISARESQALLSLLFEQIVSEEYTVRLQWAPGTVAIWDNRVTQHKPVNDFFPQHRRMHRITLQGDRPLSANSDTGENTCKP